MNSKQSSCSNSDIQLLISNHWGTLPWTNVQLAWVAWHSGSWVGGLVDHLNLIEKDTYWHIEFNMIQLPTLTVETQIKTKNSGMSRNIRHTKPATFLIGRYIFLTYHVTSGACVLSAHQQSGQRTDWRCIIGPGSDCAELVLSDLKPQRSIPGPHLSVAVFKTKYVLSQLECWK